VYAAENPTPSVESTIVVYKITDDNRDAWSGDARSGNASHEIRISGYNTTNERYEFVGNDADAESAGMQFGITIPKGSYVENAYITVKAVSFENPSSSGAMSIFMYDVGNISPFANGYLGDLLYLHPVHEQTIPWVAGTEGWTAGTLKNTPDLRSLIQTFIDRPDYMAGNYVGFVVTEGTIASGTYYGWEDYSAGTAATLTVRYSSLTLKSGDANGDGNINGTDYIMWVSNYGSRTMNGPSKGDFNQNGTVDGSDYILWLTNYGL